MSTHRHPARIASLFSAPPARRDVDPDAHPDPRRGGPDAGIGGGEPRPGRLDTNILDGQVNAILQMGTKVIVGGTFTQVRRAGFSVSFTRNYLFAFDMNTGVIDTNFVPMLNAEVEELTPGPDGTSVFVGGASAPSTA